MPAMYLQRSRRHRLAYCSQTNENTRRRQLEPSQSFTAGMPAKLNSSQLRRHAGDKDWDDQCCRPLLFSYRNSIPGSTGGHVAGASAAYENQALVEQWRQRNLPKKGAKKQGKPDRGLIRARELLRAIHHFYIDHNAPRLFPQILHNHCNGFFWDDCNTLEK